MDSILIRDLDFIITMDEADRVLRRASIYVEDGIIEAVGPYEEVVKRASRPSVVIEGRGLVAIPGLIDAHTHVIMTSMKGLASDLGDVIYMVYWPIERALSREYAYKLARLGILEALKAGITTIYDHYFFAEEVARAAEEMGIRGYIGHTVMSREGPWIGENELNEAVNFVKRWLRRSERVKPVLAPHSPETVDVSWLEYIRELSKEFNVLIHMHLAQTEREVRLVKERTGFTPVRLLGRLGLLNDNLLAAHCVFIDEEELELLIRSGVIVAQTPSTYLLDGTPYHAYKILNLGGKVVLGTDAPCYSDGIDMFREMRNLIYSQRLINRNPTVLNAQDVLALATKNASKWLKIGRLGSIKVGFKADIVLINVNKPKFRPIHDVISNIVYVTSSCDVDTVIIDGDVVINKGVPVKVSEDEIVREGEEASIKVLRRAMDNELRIREIIGSKLGKY